MSLTDALKAHADQSAQKIPQSLQTVMKTATKELDESGILELALKTGDQIPEITLPNSMGNQISIQNILKDKNIVLTFYRGGWCPYCNLELKALQDALPQLKSSNATLVAITPETPDNSLSTAEKNALDFEILTDANNTIARAFGLVFKLPENLVSVYKDFNIDLIKSNGDASQELPLAATYIIDTSGKIIYDFVSVDYKLRADPADILAVLQ